MKDGESGRLARRKSGVLGSMGALDFAGGTVVHIAAGFSGLAAILVLRKRRGYPEHAMHPNSMVLTLLGAGLLWFGWFGFNGGSALGASAQAGLALTVSQVAAAGAALSWMVVEWIHRGKPTALGFASGLVAGLVAVTPASGYVTPMGGLFIGLIAGVVCYASVCLKPFFKYDDSLDAFGVHGVGGFLGANHTGVFARSATSLVEQRQRQALRQGFDVGKLTDADRPGVPDLGAVHGRGGIAAAYAFVVTLVLVKVIDKVWGFGLSAKEESEGLDRAEHGEVGFDLSPAMEMAPEVAPHEPRSAQVPPNGKTHFTVVIDGPSRSELLRAWSNMCQAGAQPPTPEFRAVYPFVTTVKGNRFHFRGGDPNGMRETMQRLFQDRLGAPSARTWKNKHSREIEAPRRVRRKTAVRAHRRFLLTPDFSPEVLP